MGERVRVRAKNNPEGYPSPSLLPQGEGGIFKGVVLKGNKKPIFFDEALECSGCNGGRLMF